MVRFITLMVKGWSSIPYERYCHGSIFGGTVNHEGVWRAKAVPPAARPFRVPAAALTQSRGDPDTGFGDGRASAEARSRSLNRWVRGRVGRLRRWIH